MANLNIKLRQNVLSATIKVMSVVECVLVSILTIQKAVLCTSWFDMLDSIFLVVQYGELFWGGNIYVLTLNSRGAILMGQRDMPHFWIGGHNMCVSYTFAPTVHRVFISIQQNYCHQMRFWTEKCVLAGLGLGEWEEGRGGGGWISDPSLSSLVSSCTPANGANTLGLLQFCSVQSLQEWSDNEMEQNQIADSSEYGIWVVCLPLTSSTALVVWYD